MTSALNLLSAVKASVAVSVPSPYNSHITEVPEVLFQALIAQAHTVAKADYEAMNREEESGWRLNGEHASTRHSVSRS